MNQTNYVTAATLGAMQEIAVRAMLVAVGESIASKPSATIAEDVSVRLAKKLQLTGSSKV